MKDQVRRRCGREVRTPRQSPEGKVSQMKTIENDSDTDCVHINLSRLLIFVMMDDEVKKSLNDMYFFTMRCDVNLN